MPKTLKQRYEDRQVELLRERIRQVDQDLMLEQQTARLLLEAMSDEDLKNVSVIIDKLNKLKRPELPVLTKAIEQAETELNKYTGGGPLVKAWNKLKTMVGVDNPVVKIGTFADALEKGFRQIPQILKNNGVDITQLKGADLNQSLSTYIASHGSTVTQQPNAQTGAQTDQQMAKSPFTGKQVEAANQVTEAGSTNAQAKVKNVIAQFRAALSPGGVFGAFKKVPYADSQALAQELVNAPLNAFKVIYQTITRGPQMANVGADMKNLVQGQGQAQTQQTGPQQPAEPSQQTTPATGEKPGTGTKQTKPVGEVPGEPRGGGGPQKSDKVNNAFQALVDSDVGSEHNVSRGAMKAILNALDDHGLLK